MTCLECSIPIYPGDEGYDSELCPKHFKEQSFPTVYKCDECETTVPRRGLCRVCQSTERFNSIPVSKHLTRANVPPRTAAAISSPHSRTGSPPEDSIYLHGPTGSGKTYNAVSVLFGHLKSFACDKDRFSIKSMAQFVSVPQLLTDIRNSFTKPIVERNGDVNTAEEMLVAHYQDVDVLVMDDLGVEKPSDWVFTTLYLIINHRYEHNKITIFTSNYSLEELAERLNDTRLTSRIGGWCQIIKTSGKDLRNALS